MQKYNQIETSQLEEESKAEEPDEEYTDEEEVEARDVGTFKKVKELEDRNAFANFSKVKQVTKSDDYDDSDFINEEEH